MLQQVKTNKEIRSAASGFFRASVDTKYSYLFDWLGRPIIQYPQDIVGFQELVSSVQPDLIIETGIAHGGSLVLSASLLCLLDVMEGLDPRKSNRRVLGIDIDIRPHNLEAITNHPLFFKMDLFQGSSIDPEIVSQVTNYAAAYKNILASLDSNHTHDHVLAELNAYAGLVSVGSYCIVFDTVIEDLLPGSFPDRPWDVGDNPKTAVREWLKLNSNFTVDEDIDAKLLLSVAPGGYLKRIS